MRAPNGRPAVASPTGIPPWVWQDSEWAAAVHVLLAPCIWHKALAFVEFKGGSIDWEGLIEASDPWSHGEHLLVKVASNLWSGRAPVNLRELLIIPRWGQLRAGDAGDPPLPGCPPGEASMSEGAHLSKAGGVALGPRWPWTVEAAPASPGGGPRPRPRPRPRDPLRPPGGGVRGGGGACRLRPHRRLLGRVWHRLWLRHRWIGACRHARLATEEGRIPMPRGMRAVPCGDLLKVRMPPGQEAGQLATAGEKIAAFLGVRELRVVREPSNARWAWVTVVRRDPLADGTPRPWPLLAATTFSLWRPIPVGVDEDGRPVAISLPERNLLLGGEPGAGKSVALSMPVAVAALDPAVKLTLLDGKLVELAVWRGCAERFAGVEVAEAIEVLRELQAEMDARYRFLLAHGRRKVDPDDGMALHVVVDELAHYLTSGDRKQTAEFATLLRDLVSRGRAAGVIVLAATQKPSHDLIPTSLRDLFGFRWALRCSTPQASDTILGAGWASMGFSAATIDAACRGVGFLLHEGGRPVRMKACYLSDADLATLAARAQELRLAAAGSAVASPGAA